MKAASADDDVDERRDSGGAARTAPALDPFLREAAAGDEPEHAWDSDQDDEGAGGELPVIGTFTSSGAGKKRKAARKAAGRSDGPKSRRRRRTERQPRRGLKQLAPWGLAGLVVLAIAGNALLSVWDPFAPSAPVEKQYARFVDGGHGLHIDYPQDWSRTTGEESGRLLTLAEFEGDGAQVQIKISVAGAILGLVTQAGSEIARGIAQGGPQPPFAQFDPLRVVHEFRRRSFENEYSEYEEQDSESFNSPAWGPGRKSEWSGRQGLMRYKGLRATFLNGEQQICLSFRIRASRYDAFKGVFEHMLESFGQ